MDDAGTVAAAGAEATGVAGVELAGAVWATAPAVKASASTEAAEGSQTTGRSRLRRQSIMAFYLWRNRRWACAHTVRYSTPDPKNSTDSVLD